MLIIVPPRRAWPRPCRPTPAAPRPAPPQADSRPPPASARSLPPAQIPRCAFSQAVAPRCWAAGFPPAAVPWGGTHPNSLPLPECSGGPLRSPRARGPEGQQGRWKPQQGRSRDLSRTRRLSQGRKEDELQNSPPPSLAPLAETHSPSKSSAVALPAILCLVLATDQRPSWARYAGSAPHPLKVAGSRLAFPLPYL